MNRTSKVSLPPLIIIPIPPDVLATLEPRATAYAMGDCRVIHTPGHISISHPWRYPTWDEIIGVRDRLEGDEQEWIMILPRRDEYVNIHDNCFHIYLNR
jgi:hypothetical protein